MSSRADDVDRRRRHRLRRSWYVYEWASSGYVTPTSTVLFTPYLTAVATAAACPARSGGGTGEVDGVCRASLHVLGIPVAAGSLALYTVTAATLLCALVLPVVGAVADASPSPRRLLGCFAGVGAAAAASMVAVAGTDWQLGVVLLLVATLGLGSSLVVYNALLAEVADPDERDAVSTRGWAAGYAGGGLLLALDLALISTHGALGLSTPLAVRLSLLSAGLWWAAFTLVPVIGLRGLDRPRGERSRASLGAAFGRLAATARDARHHRQTLLFLVAYLFFNDGVQTVISSASLYGQAQLHLSSSQLIVAILLVQAVALVGALAFGRIAARTGARRAVLASLVVWLFVIAAGFALPERRFGLFLLLACAIGTVLGGTQSLSRSLFSQLAPAGRQGEYFSLYQATERGTSWLGTLVFGLVFQFSGSYRPAIASLVVFFVVGGVLLSQVDVRRGIAEAGNPQPLLV